MERKDIVLNNGVKMPPIGYGVFRMTDGNEPCVWCPGR